MILTTKPAPKPAPATVAQNLKSVAGYVDDAMSMYSAVVNSESGDDWAEWAQAQFEEIDYDFDNALDSLDKGITGFAALRPRDSKSLSVLMADLGVIKTGARLAGQTGEDWDLTRRLDFKALRGAINDIEAAAALLTTKK